MASGRTKDIERAFAIFDKNNDGSISAAEVRDVLKDANVQFTDAQLQAFMSRLDKDGDGTVNYNEFCQVMRDVISDALDLELRVREAFDLIDKDGNGKITTTELRQAVIDLGESISASEADDIINSIDKDGDHEVSFDEFVTLVYLLNIHS